MRSVWVDALAARVCRELRPDTCRSGMFPAWVEDDPLALAALLARIAVEDIKGSSPQAIGDHLRSTGLVDARAPGLVVAEDLVMPVLRTVRKKGVPWERWWDVTGLHVLLIELWAGRRLSTQSTEVVREELASVWRTLDHQVETFLHNAEDPYASLPPDLLHESATDRARAFLETLVVGGWVKITRSEDVLRSRPALTDRPDLAEVVKRLHRRLDLENAMERMKNPSAELLAGLRTDLDAWDAEMGRVWSQLTAHELTLLAPATEDDRYAEECLVAGKGLSQVRLLMDDALLWEPQPSANSSLPEWMVEEIVTAGTRFFHVQTGPHPVWLATAETDTQMAAMRVLIEPGARYAFEIDEYGDGLRLWFSFPTFPDDSAPLLQVPYTYSLTWVEHAWELLHLATVGFARLTVVQIVGDGDLKAVGSIWLRLPEEVCTRGKKAAITALRGLVGAETQTIRQRIATDGLDRAAEVAFRSCENAKGEDIHEELALVSDAPEYRRFMGAVRDLARARARHASSLLNHEVTHETSAELKSAAEERQRTLELLRAADDRENAKAALLDDRTVFIHLINRYGRLQLAASWTRAGRPHFDLVACEDLLLRNLADGVEEWTERSPDHPGNTWHDDVERLVSECGELARAIIEMTAPSGCDRLILSPTAPLELLPLHAAPLDSERTVTLSDAFEHITYAPTVRLVSAIQGSSRNVAGVGVLVVAHGGGHLPDISWIGGPLCEAELIANLQGNAEVLRQEEATPARALHAMSRARIVHVASHGLSHPNRWAAGLALHGSSLGEATLTASRILANGDFSSVDLVVLNACRTGAHEGTGRTVQTLRSLESAFLARGAKAVISTLWGITDLLGLVFSAVLHAHLGSGLDPRAAYADTIRYLRAHQWRVSSQQGPVSSAESAIDSVLPEWRNHLNQQVAENSLFWAGFKITGAV
ncbi:CHAT domain-containing protein [Streptomyces sp. LRE541]|uniref:CHAT domain-containing protein n=1 Tax=Streptomyces sp. LRE541 TaxID=2931983 RepID=UPI00200C0A46|nr:CHAT domain-containing protein [Streptomyces sp. LRE541]UPZ28490.1 CHAT domain-containing protein [Streptomyces sp. LRE541]